VDAFERSRQLPGRLIQSPIETRKTRLFRASAAGDFGKGCEVNAVEPSQAVPLSEISRCSAQRTCRLQGEIRRPFGFEIPFRGREFCSREPAFLASRARAARVSG
jgi:hypothetical protein